jgi:hypothetical protein
LTAAPGGTAGTVKAAFFNYARDGQQQHLDHQRDDRTEHGARRRGSNRRPHVLGAGVDHHQPRDLAQPERIYVDRGPGRVGRNR